MADQLHEANDVGRATEPSERRPERAKLHRLLALQASAGNRAVAGLLASSVQRSVAWTPGTPRPTSSVVGALYRQDGRATQPSSGERRGEMVARALPVLNGMVTYRHEPVIPRVVAALNGPQLDTRPSGFMAQPEIRVTEAPRNIGTVQVEVPPAGPWRTRLPVGVAAAVLHGSAPPGLPSTGDVDVVVRGLPSNDAIVSHTVQHELHHARDIGSAFFLVLGSWDAALTALARAGTWFPSPAALWERVARLTAGEMERRSAPPHYLRPSEGSGVTVAGIGAAFARAVAADGERWHATDHLSPAAVRGTYAGGVLTIFLELLDDRHQLPEDILRLPTSRPL